MNVTPELQDWAKRQLTPKIDWRAQCQSLVEVINQYQTASTSKVAQELLKIAAEAQQYLIDNFD